MEKLVGKICPICSGKNCLYEGEIDIDLEDTARVRECKKCNYVWEF